MPKKSAGDDEVASRWRCLNHKIIGLGGRVAAEFEEATYPSRPQHRTARRSYVHSQKEPISFNFRPARRGGFCWDESLSALYRQTQLPSARNTIGDR